MAEHFSKLESYLLQGALGDIALEEALMALLALKEHMDDLGISARWYKHRVVRSKAVPTYRRDHPEAVEAERQLHQEVRAEIARYLGSHPPCQQRIDVFYVPDLSGGQGAGLIAVVVGTLYGPESIRDEVLTEKAKRREQL